MRGYRLELGIYKRQTMALLNQIPKPIDCLLVAHDAPTMAVSYVPDRRTIIAPRRTLELISQWVREIDLAESFPQ